jgi:2',3'-cyclic-nucleotide 2'-phosphodiesterase/3'-nucleotidase/5'-nucleotidase
MNKTMLTVLTCAGIAAPSIAQIDVLYLGRYESGIFDDSAAEIVAYDAMTQNIFVTNASAKNIDIICIEYPQAPGLVTSIDLSPFGGGVNSVAVQSGLVAVAVEANVKQDPGSVVFFDTNGNYITDVQTGALPDMVTFTPDGNYVLTANEGEPDDDYLVDPEGSITIIAIDQKGRSDSFIASTADFSAFDASGVPAGVRIFGPGATPSQDLEPEYIAVSSDSTTAFVACQENNCLAVVDIASATVTALVTLGTKDHSLPGNELDASNRDDAINITNWPVHGLYLPDAIDIFSVNGNDYIISANEGDSRDYDGFSEEDRVGDLTLDPAAFPDAATLQLDENLGRLKITTTLGDTDGDGDYDELYSYGARSISIWDTAGNLVADTGALFEELTARKIPGNFNSTNDENGSFDNRSDDKGVEPEAVVVGDFNGTPYAFVGFERMGGIMTFDVSDPASPSFVDYVNSRDYNGDAAAGTAGDLAPEGFAYISAEDSPVGQALLVATHEVSGTTAIYLVTDSPLRCANLGDLNNDCALDFRDFSILLNSFGPSDPCTEGADLTRDGNIDIFDLQVLIREFAAN